MTMMCTWTTCYYTQRRLKPSKYNLNDKASSLAKGTARPQLVIKSNVDPATWKLEVEKVAPLLKVHITNDAKDWRMRLEQMQTHEQVSSSLTKTPRLLLIDLSGHKLVHE
jgi:hypothetical protein